MIGILLLTHENFGEAMIKSAELIIGECINVKAIGLNRGDDIQEFAERVKENIQLLDESEGVLVFSDLFGASPYNTAAILSKNLDNKYRCISGLNFPMLIHSILMRDSMDLDTLCIDCMTQGKENIKELFLEMN